jgi:hypothetical protein
MVSQLIRQAITQNRILRELMVRIMLIKQILLASLIGLITSHSKIWIKHHSSRIKRLLQEILREALFSISLIRPSRMAAMEMKLMFQQQAKKTKVRITLELQYYLHRPPTRLPAVKPQASLLISRTKITPLLIIMILTVQQGHLLFTILHKMRLALRKRVPIHPRVQITHRVFMTLL